MKALITILVGITLLSALSSCDRKPYKTAAYVDIKVLSQQGANLLGPPAYFFGYHNITVYYLVDGKAQAYNQAKLETSKGFLLVKDSEGKEAVRVFLDYKKQRRSSLTLIKFGETKIDTIMAEFDFQDGSIFGRQVWFNGTAKPTSFDIIK